MNNPIKVNTYKLEITSKLTLTQVKDYFKDKEISTSDYLFYKDKLRDVMTKKAYNQFFQHLQQKPNTSVYVYREDI